MSKRKTITKEEAASQALLDDCREHKINAPTIKYVIGQRVQRGCVKQSIVTDVLDDGKIVKLHEIITDTNYGNPIDHEQDYYTPWHNVCPYIETGKQAKQLSYREDVHIRYMQQAITSIFSVYYFFGLDMEPDYQRGNVWSLDDKQKLVDSIFNNVDIGKFVFIKLPFKSNSPSYECLDGKQRVTALIEFYESRFTYKGLKFSEMNYRDQSHFEDYAISVAHADEMSQKQKYDYFLKLNTSGKPVDSAHLDFVRGLADGS